MQQVQSMHILGGGFSGAVNLWPLTANIQAQALIRPGLMANSGLNRAIMAQTDNILAPTAGWGLVMRGTVLTAFAVDDVGERTAVYDFATRAEAQGQLLHVGLDYQDGGNISLIVNGSVVDTTAMGGTTAVNSAVAPWVGADSIGGNPAGAVFQLVSAMYNDNLTISGETGFLDALEFGFFNTTGSGNGMSNADYVYNVRYSMQRNPLNFRFTNSPAAAQLINQGSTQNAAETVGNLSAQAANDVNVLSLPLRVG